MNLISTFTTAREKDGRGDSSLYGIKMLSFGYLLANLLRSQNTDLMLCRRWFSEPLPSFSMLFI